MSATLVIRLKHHWCRQEIEQSEYCSRGEGWQEISSQRRSLIFLYNFIYLQTPQQTGNTSKLSHLNINIKILIGFYFSAWRKYITSVGRLFDMNKSLMNSLFSNSWMVLWVYASSSYTNIFARGTGEAVDRSITVYDNLTYSNECIWLYCIVLYSKPFPWQNQCCHGNYNVQL